MLNKYKGRLCSVLCLLFGLLFMLLSVLGSFKINTFAEPGTGGISIESDSDDSMDPEEAPIDGISVQSETVSSRSEFRIGRLESYAEDNGFHYYLNQDVFDLRNVSNICVQKKVNGTFRESSMAEMGLVYVNHGNETHNHCVWDNSYCMAHFGISLSSAMVPNQIVNLKDYRVTITITDGAEDPDGNLKDVYLTIDDLWFKYDSSRVPNRTEFIFLVGQSSGTWFSAQRGWSSFMTHVRIEDAPADQSVLYAFMDIDQPADVWDKWYTTNPDDKQETIGIYLDGRLDEGTLSFDSAPGRNKSALLNNHDDYLYVNTWYDPDWMFFMSKQPTTEQVDVRRAGFSILGQAAGSWLYFSAWDAGTCMTLDSSGFNRVNMTTYVRYQGSDGSWGSYNKENARSYLKGEIRKYGYTWKRKDSDEKIYDLSSKYAGMSTAAKLSASKSYYIDVPRFQYTYSFESNLPDGINDNRLSSMPSDFTRYAESNSDSSISSPKLTGYKFKGWNTKVDGSGLGYPGKEPMLSDETFYAIWEPDTYTVHYDGNGSSNPDHEAGEFTQNTVSGAMADSVFQFDVAGNLRQNAYVREGYAFAGWNTKADGSGTSYADKQEVVNLISYDKKEITLYAQWKKKLGKEVIKVISEETGNPVSGVSMKLQKSVNGTWVDVTTGSTGSDGSISVSSLHWFNYRWVMTDVPDGYVKSADTAFKITYNELDKRNEVILYMQHASIVVDSQVSDIIEGERAPAFLYHISGVDVAGVKHEYDLLVQVNQASKFGANTVPDVFAGQYTITQVPVSRYIPGNAVGIRNGAGNGINASADVRTANSAEVKFPYSIREYGWYYGVNSADNKIK